MTLVPTDEGKDILKKYEELWSKFRYRIRSTSNCLHDSKLNYSENYDETYTKIKSNSDIDLLLKKTLEFLNMMIVPRLILHEGDKCYPQVLLD